MAHPAQRHFCEAIKKRFPQYFSASFVMDVGSLDINGNNHFLFDPESLYLGVDVAPGPNVDIVSPAHEIGLPDCTFDVIVSTECLEHDRHWEKTLTNAVRMLRPGGLLLLTCATTGRPEHGTRRTSPQDAPLLGAVDEQWADYYRNLTEADIRGALDMAALFQLAEFDVNPQTHDLYVVAIRHGVFERRNDRSASLTLALTHARESEIRRQFDVAADELQRAQTTLTRAETALTEELKHTQEAINKAKAAHANLLRA